MTIIIKKENHKRRKAFYHVAFVKEQIIHKRIAGNMESRNTEICKKIRAHRKFIDSRKTVKPISLKKNEEELFYACQAAMEEMNDTCYINSA